MTSRPNKRTAFAAALLAALLLCSGGCAWIGSALENAGKDYPGASSAVSSPAADATKLPESTQYLPPNPVFALFTDWFTAVREAGGGLTETVSELGADDYELAREHSRLCSCESALSLVYATAGMMTNDGSGWSGSFTGAFEGSGTMSSRGVFEYVFSDGRVLAGRIDDGLLICRLGEDVEPFDPSEPTPLPTDAPEASPAEQTENAEEPSEEPAETALVTEAPPPDVPLEDIDWRDAGQYSGETAVMALKRTESGFVGVVARGGKLSIIEVIGDTLNYAGDASSAVKAGLDPLSGTAGLDTLGCRVFVYERGRLGFEPLA